MNARVSQKQERVFFLKACKDLWDTKNTIKTLKQNITSSIELSILGRFPTEVVDDTTIALLKSYKEQLLGASGKYGFFSNAQIGTIFILGPLTSIFLREMNQKVLGAMNKGPYGILRGLGVDEEKAKVNINALKLGRLILIIRGFSDDLYVLEDILYK